MKRLRALAVIDSNDMERGMGHFCCVTKLQNTVGAIKVKNSYFIMLVVVQFCHSS
jgi:hypothetical protein